MNMNRPSPMPASPISLKAHPALETDAELRCGSLPHRTFAAPLQGCAILQKLCGFRVRPVAARVKPSFARVPTCLPVNTVSASRTALNCSHISGRAVGLLAAAGCSSCCACCDAEVVVENNPANFPGILGAVSHLNQLAVTLYWLSADCLQHQNTQAGVSPCPLARLQHLFVFQSHVTLIITHDYTLHVPGQPLLLGLWLIHHWFRLPALLSATCRRMQRFLSLGWALINCQLFSGVLLGVSMLPEPIGSAHIVVVWLLQMNCT